MSAGHIRQRGRDSWELKYDAARDPVTGKRTVKYKTVRGSKRDAQRELRKLLDAVENGTHTDAGKLTLAAWLTTWTDGRRHSISAKTAERYDELIAKHINPQIGHVLLPKVTPVVLNGFYAERLERGRLDGKGGLSPQTVRHLDRLLHRAFHDAVRARLLAMNPTDYVDRPKPQRKPKATLQGDELPALLAKASGGRLYAPVFIILATGCRRGELLALRWRDIDLDASVAQVVQTLEETKQHGLRMKDVKTAAGRRRIDLPGSAIGVLKAHQIQQKKAALAQGISWSTDGLVFPYAVGLPWKPRNFTKAVKTLAASAGIAKFSPHAGRHDHFTRLLQGGIHPKVAQVRAGHSSVVVTLDIYSHVTDGMQQPAAEHIDNVLRPVAEK